jgi:membrane protein DedA with SNARE-associated domain
MYETKAVIAVVVGCAIIIFCFSPLQEHYTRILYGASASNRKIPTWLTRLVGSFVGTLFLIIGFTYLLFGR